MLNPYPSAYGNASQPLNIRASQHDGYFRIVLEGPEAVISQGSVKQISNYVIVRFPDIQIELSGRQLPLAYEVQNDTVAIAAMKKGELNVFFMKNPSRLVIDIKSEKSEQIQESGTVIRDENRLDETDMISMIHPGKKDTESSSDAFQTTGQPLRDEPEPDVLLREEVLEEDQLSEESVTVTNVAEPLEDEAGVKTYSEMNEPVILIQEIPKDETVDIVREQMHDPVVSIKYSVPMIAVFAIFCLILIFLLKSKVQRQGGQQDDEVLSRNSGDAGESCQTACKLTDDDRAQQRIGHASTGTSLEALKWVDARTLASFLEREHPQTVALAICLLETEQAAEILQLLPEAMRSDVTIRIAETRRIPEHAVEVIESILTSQLNLTNVGEHKSFEGTKAIAEILKHCNRTIEQTILQKVDSCDTELANSIKEEIFKFDDIEKIDDRGIDVILKHIDTDELSIALRNSPEHIQDKFFSNMSERASKILKGKMGLKGPVKLSDVKKAQKSIAGTVKKLDEEGMIIIAGRGKEKVVL